MVFGDIGRVADAVHARRRRVHEAPHPGVARRHHQRLEALVVDRPAQGGVQLEARIVGDAGQVDDGVGAAHRLRHHGAVTDVALHALERPVPGGQDVVAEEEEVQHTHPMAARQQLWNEDCAHVARTARDDHRALVAHAEPSLGLAPRTRIAHQVTAIVLSARMMLRHDTALERPCVRS